jgi:hypothetical protein
VNKIYPEPKRYLRPLALTLTALLTMPVLASCGGGSQSTAPPPPVDDTRGGTQVNPGSTTQAKPKQGLSTGQKVAVTLVGAAALYYLYRQHQKKQQEGPQGKYYLSKNGRVYYRDAQHRAHYVTPPPGGIQVPPEEAEQYRGFKGYNNSQTGKDLTALPADAGVAP